MRDIHISIVEYSNDVGIDSYRIDKIVASLYIPEIFIDIDECLEIIDNCHLQTLKETSAVLLSCLNSLLQKMYKNGLQNRQNTQAGMQTIRPGYQSYRRDDGWYMMTPLPIEEREALFYRHIIDNFAKIIGNDTDNLLFFIHEKDCQPYGDYEYSVSDENGTILTRRTYQWNRPMYVL